MIFEFAIFNLIVWWSLNIV